MPGRFALDRVSEGLFGAERGGLGMFGPKAWVLTGRAIEVRCRLPRRPGSYRLEVFAAFRVSAAAGRFRRTACDAAKPACLAFPCAARREGAA